MPAARPRGPVPLTDDDVTRLRDSLASGTEPRVQLLVDTAAAPAGTRGPVVALRDPAAQPEFIVLRVGGDEVPFSPAELTLPTRSARRAPDAAAGGVETGVRSSDEQRPAEPAGEGAREAAGEGAGAAVASASPPTGEQAAVPASSPPAVAMPTGTTPPARRPRTPSGSTGAASALTVTLRFTGSEWTAETTRGGRRSKARPVPAAAVRALAERLDDADLRRAVLAAVEACREQALARAERLRAELEQVETVLAQLEDD